MKEQTTAAGNIVASHTTPPNLNINNISQTNFLNDFFITLLSTLKYA